MAHKNRKQTANGILDPDIFANRFWDQIVVLQHEVCNVNLQIERQKFLINSLEPNVQKGIITPEESQELRSVFSSKQNELMKAQNYLLEMIQQIRIKNCLNYQ